MSITIDTLIDHARQTLRYVTPKSRLSAQEMERRNLQHQLREMAGINNPDYVGPGQPMSLNDAATIGDGVWQGDLGIEVVAGKPAGYVDAKPQTQLVPGNTVGARHILQDLTTVVDFALPTNWSTDASYEGLQGPYFRCAAATTIAHPVHGPVNVAAGHCVQLRYQRDLDLDTLRERRALD